jgi:hypothetical protein
MSKSTWDEQVDIVTRHYIIAALWADCEEGTNPRCDNKQKATAREACEKFMRQCEDAGGLFTKAMERFEHGYGTHPDAGSAEAAFGHDFWLTRQGHGVGFWDREPLRVGNPSLGDLLTEEAKKVGECYHYQHAGWFYFDE